MRPPLALLFPVALALSGCAADRTSPEPPPPQSVGGPSQQDVARLATLVSWMSGSFDSAQQAGGDSDYFDIRLRMTPIWTERPGAGEETARWLYVEQAMATQPTRPYRQRIYRVAPLGGGRFTSEVFELPGDPLVFAGAWKRPQAFETLQPKDLTAREGCTVTLTDRGDGFVGSTNARDCASTLRGAAYATSDVVITRDQIVSWDRGFDDAGTQVWGATKGGYIFRKRAD